jgi:hypothetical protein
MNEATRRGTAVGVFEDREQVDRAVDGLRRAGFSNESIGVAIHGDDAIGSGIGWMAGALTSIGLDEENAQLYAQEFHSGRQLVTVVAGDRQREARGILASHGAYDYNIESGGTRTVQDRPRFGRWDDVQSSFREGWERRHGGTGATWEEFEPRYRFGWELSREPQYRDRDWSEVEPELRHQWEMDEPDTLWERAIDSLREAWEEMRGTGSPLVEPKEARRREDRAA